MIDSMKMMIIVQGLICFVGRNKDLTFYLILEFFYLCLMTLVILSVILFGYFFGYTLFKLT